MKSFYEEGKEVQKLGCLIQMWTQKKCTMQGLECHILEK
jgi:hypothetical protein